MAERRTYELINPSDRITFVATPLEAAFIADRMAAALYFVKEAESGAAPSFPIEELQAAYNAMWSDREALQSYAAAYASFIVAPARDRRVFDELMAGKATDEDRRAARQLWNEERRTSFNDICLQCWETADKIAAYEPEARP